MSRILITGGTGLIGQVITKLLMENGHEVGYLTRDPSNTEGGVKLFVWDLNKNYIDPAAILWAEQIIHLAGESVAGGRWTKSKKESILTSRVDSTRLLCNGLKDLNHNVNTFVSASAIGAYGSDLSQEWVTESSAFGTDFLADVVNEWEMETQPIKDLGIRTVNIRVGIVLSSKGGALEQIAKPIKYGVGAVVGSGKQMMSWIHIEDLARMFGFALNNTNMEGIYNGVAPNAVSNRDFTYTLAKVLKRSILLPPVPGFVLKIMLGEMSIIVLGGKRVSCEKILKTGFEFSHKDLKESLTNLLVDKK